MSRSRRAPVAPLAMPALLALVLAARVLALDVPYLGARVNDYAGMIPPDVRERIETKLAASERRTTNQIAILTVDGLEGESLEEFSMRVAETWKLGRKGKDNGVLFVVAKADRKMRIETGYGLESVLTDAVSGRILDERVRPRFKAGDFPGGLEAGADAILAVLDGEALPEASPPAANRAAVPVFARVLGLVVFTIVVGLFSLLAVLGPGAPSWFLYVFLAPFWAVFPSALIHPMAGVVLAAAWLVGLPLARILLHRSAAGKGFLARHAGLVRFASSGGRGGGSGGGFSRGGGFSGGGGSFGGGGASSGW